MKKFIIIISLIFVLFTETAHAASVRIGVIDTGVKEKEGIIDGEKILDGKKLCFRRRHRRRGRTWNESGKPYYRALPTEK